jgi:hypothetical protein
VFYCHDNTCPQHDSQFLFCENCNNDITHNHRPARIDTKSDGEQQNWKILLAKAENKKASSANSLESMSKLLEFFETVAEVKNIELENPPKRMLEDLNGFCSVINDWVNEEQDCVSF